MEISLKEKWYKQSHYLQFFISLIFLISIFYSGSLLAQTAQTSSFKLSDLIDKKDEDDSLTKSPFQNFPQETASGDVYETADSNRKDAIKVIQQYKDNGQMGEQINSMIDSFNSHVISNPNQLDQAPPAPE